jgi:N-dimethylarginine dimethylaminohydrolase
VSRTASNEYGRLARVVLKHAREAFAGDALIREQWRDLRFTAPPGYDRAVAEYDRFAEALLGTDADVRWLPAGDAAGLDSIYVRDASVVCPGGIILCRMAKPQRALEPRAQERAFAEWGLPIAGAIRAPGTLEGGDVVWLDEQTVAVGEGYRTNAEGIRQLSRLLGPGVEVVTVPLPHWRGPGDVFHLMSMLSPVDRDLAVAYSPLLPVVFREWLLDRGIELVEVSDGELETMGANVLAVAPRRCVMLAGNPRTRAGLEAAGAEVIAYAGDEISVKGGGGPTCLTRPLVRALP